MSSKRIKSSKRCPSATFVCNAVLKGYQLKFNKISKDGSSKANLIKTCNKSDSVLGIVYSVPNSEKRGLDIAEGKGHGYEEFSIKADCDGIEIPCQCYLSIDPHYINDNLLPYHWYLDHCIEGALEHNLPDSFIAFLKEIPNKFDSDAERTKIELAIYEG